MQTIPLNTDSSSDAVLELLFKLKVKDVMNTDVTTFSPSSTMRQIQHCMKEKKFTGIPITENEKLIGIVSVDNIISAFDTQTVDEECRKHMTTDLIVLQKDMPVSFAVSCFNKYKFGRFPVIDKDQKVAGILSTTDLIAALLSAIASEVERLEHEEIHISSKKQHENKKEHFIPEEQTLEFKTAPFDFKTAGLASTEIKKTLRARGVDRSIARRVGIASYELEINQVVHSNGGTMRYILTSKILIIEAQDTGPGIPDLEKALTEGFSTASERVRSFGFGAGMGLPNTQRVSDKFDIYSTKEGTTVHAIFNLE